LTINIDPKSIRKLDEHIEVDDQDGSTRRPIMKIDHIDPPAIRALPSIIELSAALAGISRNLLKASWG
jgi:hypothetical protein